MILKRNFMNESEEISWLPLILVAFATFIITLDSTFMNVSISQLIIDLNTSLSTIQLIISFYALTTASLMLLSSKLQDILGKKKIFLIGALLFGIGALIASISFNSIMLFIGWSLLEGVGGALMTPATISIISSTYVNDRRTRALAVLSAMGGIAAAIGPIFGGFITTFISWRAGFVFELAIIVFIFAYSSRIKDFRPMAKTNLDIVGAVMSILGLVFFVLGILNLKSNLILSFLLIVIAIAVFYFFVRYEIKFKQAGLDPLVDIGLLKDYNLKIGMISRLLLMMVMIGSLFAVSVFLQGVLGFSAIVTGLCLIPATGGILISAILVPKLSKKYDSIFLMVLGCILAIIACIVLRNQ